MKKKKPFRGLWAVCYTCLLLAFTVYVLLDTFVIVRKYEVVETAQTTYGTGMTDSAAATAADSGVAAADSSEAVSAEPFLSETSPKASPVLSAQGDQSSTPVVTDTSYQDDACTIQLSEYRAYDTTIYVADVVLSDPAYLKTLFAQNTFGKNVTETTSAMAESCGAILAINGDFYGSQNRGYVVRNGTLYRSTAASADQEDLVVYADGSMDIVTEGAITAQTLVENGAVQVWSFGPGLIENGEIAVTDGEEVGRAKASNPRTAIGYLGNLHYVMVVSDGRTSESAGLSLSQLAEFMQSLQVETAYNLDGGGSSTMYFNGAVVNNPTTNGRSIQERSVSDIVYLGV